MFNKKTTAQEGQSKQVHQGAEDDALILMEELSMLYEKGVMDVPQFLQILRRTSENSDKAARVRNGARVMMELIEVRGQERRELTDLAKAITNLTEKMQQAEGAWPQVSKDIEDAANETSDETTKAFLECLQTEIQRFINSYLMTVLQVLKKPLKSSELSGLLKHFLEKGEDEGEETTKTTLEAEVVLEAIRQKYAHPLLLMKSIIGADDFSSSGRVLLNSFHELSKDFPAVGKPHRIRRYLVSQYEKDRFLGKDIKTTVLLLEKKEKEERRSKNPSPSEPDSDSKISIEKESLEKEPQEEVELEIAPPATLAFVKKVYKTHAAKLVDAESGSLAPGQTDLLDEAMNFIHLTWKNSRDWEPHPNYEALRYYRDYMVRLLTMGQAMEQMLRGYREIHRYNASDLMTVDTRRFLRLPAVKEIVCMMLYPKFDRIPGFNTRIFESMLGAQYGRFLRCCREVLSLDIFVHADWSGNLQTFLKKFDLTYEELVHEDPEPLKRILTSLFRPF